MQVELFRDAATPEEYPDDGLPEVAILGRSNVGKSSLLNSLVGRRSVARTSGRPGKTRRIHFYRVASAFHLVDLPGYGWAAVSKRERAAWRPMAEAYLRGERATLAGAILLVDLRRGPEREELDLLDWLVRERIDVAVALTKADKLSAAKGAERAREQARALGLPQDRVARVSARTGAGLDALAAWIRAWTGVRLLRPDGTPLEPDA